jgi:chemotaxis protein MotA
VGTIVGLIVVFGAVLGGFAMAGGPIGVLVQPYELIVIAGAALGTLIISAPGKVRSRVLHALAMGFKGSTPTRADYVELLKLLYELCNLMRREGIVALEPHATNPASSPIFQRYTGVMARANVSEFLTDALRQMLDGCSVEDLTQLFDADLETMHEEHHQPIGLLKTTGDALPGLGIVAAVLGIVITMGHLNGGPEEIGHHVAAALVGTFIGILLCYGVLSPIATSIELQTNANARFLVCIKDALLAAARGSNPAVAMEFARRAIFSDERPSSADLEQEFSALRARS